MPPSPVAVCAENDLDYSLIVPTHTTTLWVFPLTNPFFVFLLSLYLPTAPCIVPLTATAADLVEKVQWLKQNQDMAKTLAANARNFAASYLRLEDYHCYIATLLEKLPEVCADVDDFHI